MTTRRAFFGQITALFTSLAGITACSKDEETGNTETGSTVTNENLLNAFVDTIVPRDQDAGAVEAGMPAQLKEYFSKKPGEEKKAQAMLKSIDDISRGRFQNSFDQCALAQREMVLDIISKSRDEKYKPVRTTIFRLRSRIIRAFYASPTAWEMLAFTAPYPGGYPDFNRPPD
jgi:hypothetical protein